MTGNAMHGDMLESDEVWVAAARIFEMDWTTEPDLFVLEVPTFDKAGNLYFSPLDPETVHRSQFMHEFRARF